MKKISDTKALRIYGPYLKRKQIIWYLYKDGKEYRAKTKLKLLELVDKFTTEISKVTK